MLIGTDDSQAERYKDELEGFVKVLDSEKAFEHSMINPLFAAEDRKRVLLAVIDKMGLSDIVKSFLVLLFEKRRFDHTRGITDYYKKLVDEYKGIVRADVVSATALSGDAVEKIRVSLSRMTGKSVILDIKQDETLIGGVVTKVGDIVLDGSIKTQLANMKESLRKGERV
jgi:F-type H+-transporting ATPase subunit delta